MYTLNDILTGTGGTLDPQYPGPADLLLREVVIDSRTAGPGTLFVALPGQVYDGHEFVVDAVGHGAVGPGSSRCPLPGDLARRLEIGQCAG